MRNIDTNDILDVYSNGKKIPTYALKDRIVVELHETWEDLTHVEGSC